MRRLFLKYKLIILIFMIITSFCIIMGSQVFPSDSAETPPIELKDGWHYKWSNSFSDKLKQEWIDNSELNPDWIPYKYTGKPLSKEANFNTVWFRLKLPDNKWISPSLYFDRMCSESFIIYLDGKETYSYEKKSPSYGMADATKSRFIVPLTPDPQNKILLIKYFSTQNIIGLYNGVYIGSHKDILKMYLINGFNFFVLGFFLLIFGVFLLINCIFLKGENRKILKMLSLFLISLGFAMSSQSYIVHLVPIENRNLWEIINHLSTLMVPVFLMGFFVLIFSSDNKLFMKVLWRFHLIYMVFYLLFGITNVVTNSHFIISISFLDNTLYALLFVDLIIQLTYVVIYALKGNIDAKIFMGGFIAYAAISLTELILYLTIQRIPVMAQWGMLILVGSFVLILGRRFAEMHSNLLKYSRELEVKNESLNHAWREVGESRDQIAEWNKMLEQTVINRTGAIRNLLNNAGQGFLSFGEDLLIDEEYSLECINIFGEKIGGKKFSDLIHKGEEQKRLLQFMLVKILQECSESKRELYIPLLPDEVEINGRYVKMEYKIIDSINDENREMFMVILTDVTDKKALKSKMEEERKILKMVVKAVTNFNSFTRYFKDYRDFCNNGIRDIIKSKRPLNEIVFEIFRSIHTFKGIFSQVDMVNIVGRLHDFEDVLSNLRKDIDNLTLEDFKGFLEENDLYAWLEEDIKVLKDILGDSFFNQEKAIFVDQTKLLEIEQKIQEMLPQEHSALLLPDLKKLRYKPINELLKHYPDYIIKLSEKLEKPIYPLSIEGGDIPVDIEKYSDFVRSLVHVFRNAVDHGIESVDKRIECGKDEYGNIKCMVSKKEKHIQFSISDDGQGINFEKIRNRALQKGLIYDEAAAASENDLLNYIYFDDFSTKDEITGISGRGIGMAAVKNEVEKIGGQLEIKTEAGKGTEFLFMIPLDN